MIEEAYCSYEVAKLLNEKGFVQETLMVYNQNGNFMPNGAIRDTYQNFYSAPTHQMAMAWLREVHYLWIDIEPLTNYKWTWGIWLMSDPKFKMGESSQVISTYKEAIEAALKYVLENLI